MNRRNCFVTVMAYLVFAGCASKPAKQLEAKAPDQAEVNDLPQVTLIEPNGSQFSARSLPGNTMLIFFGASWHHFQPETTQIHNNIQRFERYTPYFISINPFPTIAQSAHDYGLTNPPNIRFM